MKIRISSRQSELAQFQAYQVGDALQKLGGIEVQYLFRESLGDKNLTDPLWKMPEKGVFTEDFYQDLVNDNTDLVVHSWKDLPTEVKPDTYIAATLARADQRDLLLFKKSSVVKKEVKIFSSSPRRAHNLGHFLKLALPAQPENIQFESVRGNIVTRIKKWRDNPSIDGLVLAKAAIDRLCTSSRFLETQQFIKSILKENLWMVLPLSENPNAAAQGALAIEILSKRTDLADILSRINCNNTFSMAAGEREILQSFGGGCHLALGMSLINKKFGQIKIVKGLTPSGDKIDSREFFPIKSKPLNLINHRMKFLVSRTQLNNIDTQGLNAIYVAKAEAWNLSIDKSLLIWTSGTETWKKLAAHGVWVSGTNESLGENEPMQIDHFYENELKWGRLSHSQASSEGKMRHLAGYDVNLTIASQELPTNAAYTWMSPLEFDLAIQKFPELKLAHHICGPGRTYDALLKRLGSDERLYVELLTYK